MLDFYAKRANPTLSHKDVEAGVHTAMVTIQQDAFKIENGDDLKKDVGVVSEYVEGGMGTLTPFLPHSPAHSLTHSLTHSFLHSFTHSLTHSLTRPLAHTLAHSLTPRYLWTSTRKHRVVNNMQVRVRFRVYTHAYTCIPDGLHMHTCTQ